MVDVPTIVTDHDVRLKRIASDAGEFIGGGVTMVAGFALEVLDRLAHQLIVTVTEREMLPVALLHVSVNVVSTSKLLTTAKLTPSR